MSDIEQLTQSALAGIEVKASSAPKPEEARHLVWLRKQLGDQVAACVLFHTGPTAYTIAPGVQALPISSIWSPVSGSSIGAPTNVDIGS